MALIARQMRAVIVTRTPEAACAIMLTRTRPKVHEFPAGIHTGARTRDQIGQIVAFYLRG